MRPEVEREVGEGLGVELPEPIDDRKACYALRPLSTAPSTTRHTPVPHVVLHSMR